MKYFAQILNGHVHSVFEAVERPDFAGIELIEVTAVSPRPAQGWGFEKGVFVPPRPSTAHDWDAKSNTWILIKAKAAELKAAELAAAKSAKLSEIATAAQALIDTIVFDSAPAFERETYALQAAEALAWSRDKSAKTPVLDGIAAARGVPLELLKVKALEKSQQYQALCGAVAGQRQAFEDQVNAAADAAGVALIVPTYRVA